MSFESIEFFTVGGCQFRLTKYPDGQHGPSFRLFRIGRQEDGGEPVLFPVASLRQDTVVEIAEFFLGAAKENR